MDRHFSAPSVASSGSGDDGLNKYAADLDDIPDNWDDDPSVVTSAPAPLDPTPLPDDHETAIGRSSVVPPAQEQAVEPELPASPPPETRSANTRQETPRPAASSHDSGSAVAAFAAGAGLDPALMKVTDQDAFFEDLGALLKTMTEGLMQAITARGQVKSEFRLEQTMIAPTENNPFKFSASTDEAMMRLLHHKDGAYLSGIAAAVEAVDDINAHQLAVMAGTEAALKSIMRRFNPKKLESRFGNDSAMGKAVPMLKKARYWEFYKVLYTEISEAVDDDFQQLFGSEFSNAYEEQLERLKISRKESLK
jgi:type VI secretion system FHA domain protein